MTGSVRLRRAEPNDAGFLHAIRNEPAAGRFQPLRPYSEGQLRELIERRATAPLDSNLDGKVQWVILADDRPAGWVSLDVTSREHAVGAVGYTVGEAFHGRGIATRALQTVVDIAFASDQVNLERLEAVVAVGNIASRRVLENAGFSREGIARGLLRVSGSRIDHYRYGRLRADRPGSVELPSHQGGDRKDTSRA